LPPSVSVSTSAPGASRVDPKEVSTPKGVKVGKGEAKAPNAEKAQGQREVSKPGLEVTSAGTKAGRRAIDDDFEPSQAFGKPIQAADLPVIPPSVPGNKPRSGVLELLDEAEEPGVFFKERERGDGERDDEEEDDELEEAVEEAIRQLFGVRGVYHIGPGEDVNGNPVVLISANQGFSNSSLERIPPVINGFKTLLALPYELLPLRRDRS
jgi:hypothetical protein